MDIRKSPAAIKKEFLRSLYFSINSGLTNFFSSIVRIWVKKAMIAIRPAMSSAKRIEAYSRFASSDWVG